MISLIFIINILITLSIWWVTFRSKLWYKSTFTQLFLFILPLFVGLSLLLITFLILKIETLKYYRYYISLYTSINLLLLIPQFYKLSWSKLVQTRNKLFYEDSKIAFAVGLVIFMVLSMVFLFAIYFYWFSLIGGNQGLLSALHGYEYINLDFTTSIYFSFVTYFTLGYGDLVPYGFWMRTFVFLECIMSILNTGLILIYVYNFLFNEQYAKDEDEILSSKNTNINEKLYSK